MFHQRLHHLQKHMLLNSLLIMFIQPSSHYSLAYHLFLVFLFLDHIFLKHFPCLIFQYYFLHLILYFSLSNYFLNPNHLHYPQFRPFLQLPHHFIFQQHSAQHLNIHSIQKQIGLYSLPIPLHIQSLPILYFPLQHSLLNLTHLLYFQLFLQLFPQTPLFLPPRLPLLLYLHHLFHQYSLLHSHFPTQYFLQLRKLLPPVLLHN